MAIPDYQTIMLPLLKFADDKKEHLSRDAVNYLTQEFNLTEEEQKTMLPSGSQPLFSNRVGWASTYIKKAGLIESKKRGYFNITERGLNVLLEHPDRIDIKFLEKFQEFVEFRKMKKKPVINPPLPDPPTGEYNPEELLGSSYLDLQVSLISDVLETIKKCSYEFFENLVLDVLIKMGYGGSKQDEITLI